MSFLQNKMLFFLRIFNVYFIKLFKSASTSKTIEPNKTPSGHIHYIHTTNGKIGNYNAAFTYRRELITRM